MAKHSSLLQLTNLEGLDELVELALDMHGSWNPSADAIWRELDPRLWELTHNPWGVLQTVSRARLEALLGGDLDTHGFAILDRLRAHPPHARFISDGSADARASSAAMECGGIPSRG